jgi:cyclophilin family peptidyl-prolyl cis-trans isomerase
VAIARAIGRCGAEESEPTLVAWLGGPRERAAAAAYGLGELAIGKKKLREETLVALLNLAAGSASSPPLVDALFPVGRLENVPSTVVDRIREVAAARLAERAEARMFAIRALGRAGLDAGPELGRVLASPEQFTAAERAEAARMAKRLKAAGERALVEALPKLAPPTDPVAMTGLIGEELGVLLAVLESLDGWKPDGPGAKTLRDLATLALPSGAPAALLRRVTHIRCGAAKLLAVANWREPLLVSCDAGEPAAAAAAPDAGAPSDASKLAGGSIGLRAVVAVLGRAEITGPRLQAWRSIALDGELRAREAALELLEAHGEVDAAEVLAQALSSDLDGVVATAADVIAKQPQRASVSSRKVGKGKRKKDKPGDGKADAVVSEPAPAIAKALLARLAAASELKDAEVLASVVDAAGALALKEAAPPLEALCASSWPTLRSHAAKALDAIGGKKGKTCEPPAAGGPAPRELDGLVAGVTGGVVTLVFDSDVGELTLALDAGIAPVTVTRVVQLARAGYYDGMVVHRVVPGFVTQFGAPHGDGFGGPPDRPPLRCETSPLPFAPLSVGVALAGRDTGSSQLFVMHARHPHLDGGYAWVGSATGPWSAFVDGDRITKVRIRP